MVAPIQIGPGISIGPGVTVEGGITAGDVTMPAPPVPNGSLVF